MDNSGTTGAGLDVEWKANSGHKCSIGEHGAENTEYDRYLTIVSRWGSLQHHQQVNISQVVEKIERSAHGQILNEQIEWDTLRCI